MKLKQKIIICLLIILSLIPNTAFGFSLNEGEQLNAQVIPKEIREFKINNQVEKEIELQKKYDELIEPNSRAIYTTEVMATKYITLSGYAGNQSVGGTKFPTGGGFFWADSGGPVISGSLSFTFPTKYVDVSVGLGISTDNPMFGKWVSVPNSYDYFKLYVEKTMEVKHINIYRQERAGSPKVLYMTTYPSTQYRESCYARKVY